MERERILYDSLCRAGKYSSGKWYKWITIRKIDDKTYKFTLASDKPENKIFTTSARIKEIDLTGYLVPANNNAAEIKVLVRLYKNGVLKDEFPFKFETNSYPYYNITM